jgi:hypothetical protein
VAAEVARNATEAMVGSEGVVYVWRESGVWSQAVRFYVGAFGRNVFGRCEDVFTSDFVKKKF